MLAHIFVAALLLASAVVCQDAGKVVPSEIAHDPLVIRADLPLYPPVARSAHISGTVEIQVTVEKGAVVDAQVKSLDIQITDPSHRAVYDDRAKIIAGQLLSDPTLANVKSWRFQSEDRTTFVVKYVYRIEGDQTRLPENPKVELDLPRCVRVTVRPFKPTTT